MTLPISALAARLDEVQERARQRAERKPLPGAPLAANVVQLPIWPEPTRGVPNGMLRSALFGALAKGARRYLERERIAALEGIDINYTGQRLDQGDLDVWANVLHITRIQMLGDECRVTGYQLLKALGKSDTGGNREVLHNRLLRLKANAIEVRQGRFSYIGSLIDEAYKDEETREYVIVLNPRLRALFAADQFTRIEWAVRHELGGKPLAQWLHGYYASHAKPYQVKVGTLHRLCGSEAALLTDFKKELRRGLNAVAEASEAYGQPFRYEIRGDLVHVEKKGRHLEKKAAKPRT